MCTPLKNSWMDSQSQCDADRKATFVVLCTDSGSHKRRAIKRMYGKITQKILDDQKQWSDWPARTSKYARVYEMGCSWCTLNCCKDVNEGKTLWFKFKCKAALLKVESEMLRDMPCLLLLMAPPAAEAPSWSSDPESDPEFDDPVEAGNDDCPDDGGGIDEVACKACNRGCWWCPAPRGAAECNNGIGRCTDPEAGRDNGDGMSSKASRSSSSSSVSRVAMAAMLTSALLLWLLIIANSSRMASSSALASPLTEPEDFLAASLVDSWSLIKELGGRFLLGWLSEWLL